MRVLLGVVIATALWWALAYPVGRVADDCLKFFSDTGCSGGAAAVLWTWLIGFVVLTGATVVVALAALVRSIRRRRVA